MAFDRDTVLRAVRFERPTTIPMRCHLNGACWHHYPHDALVGLIGAHPTLFPDTPAAPQAVFAPW